MESDVNLACSDCGKLFLFSHLEQEFFREKGLSNKPKRCHDCRLTNRQWRKSRAGVTDGTVTEVQCDLCGALTKVPFTPKGHKPIYCAGCLHRPAMARQTGLSYKDPPPPAD